MVLQVAQVAGTSLMHIKLPMTAWAILDAQIVAIMFPIRDR